ARAPGRQILPPSVTERMRPRTRHWRPTASASMPLRREDPRSIACEASAIITPMSGPAVDIIPIGGLGQFGMNCTLLRAGDEVAVVDAGMMFPPGDFWGVDAI